MTEQTLDTTPVTAPMLFTVLTDDDAILAQTGISAADWNDLSELLKDVNVVLVATKNPRNIRKAMLDRGIPKVRMTKRPDGYAVWI